MIKIPTNKEKDNLLSVFDANTDVKQIKINTDRDLEVYEFLKRKEKVLIYDMHVGKDINAILTTKGINIVKMGGYRAIACDKAWAKFKSNAGFICIIITTIVVIISLIISLRN